MSSAPSDRYRALQIVAAVALAGVTGAIAAPQAQVQAAAQTRPGTGITSPRPVPLGPLPVAFDGVVPCAGCRGIRHILNLFPDQSFFHRTIYLGKRQPNTFDAVGRWSRANDGTLVLWAGRDGLSFFRVVTPQIIRKLDDEGRETAPPRKFDLTRASRFGSIEPQLALHGIYRPLADSGTFTECLTGKRLPVVPEGDSATLRTGTVAQIEALVAVEGRILSRASRPGAGAPFALLVQKVVNVSPGDSGGGCGEVPSQLPLENTYWRPIRLRDRLLTAGEPRSERYVRFNSGGASGTSGARVQGSTGCNSMFGTYVLDGNTVVFRGLGGTKMACAPALMAEEQELLDALQETATWRILGSNLDLFGSSGVRLVRFEAMAPR